MLGRRPLVVAVLLAACDADPVGPVVPVASVSIAVSASRLVPDQTLHLEAQVRGEDGEPITDRPVSWLSDAPAVATVSAAGVVRTHALGWVTITARVEGRSGSARFEVVPLGVARIRIQRDGEALSVRRTIRLGTELFDAADAPVDGIAVDWTTSDPSIATIADDGTMRGIAQGRVQVSATVAGARDEVEVFVEARPLPQPLAGFERMTVPTYDGSGEVVHPDIVHFPTAWRGWEYWMAITPYPNGDARLENPSIVVSHDGRTWVAPAGIRNPVAARPSMGYNSDPDLLYDAAGDRLVLVYREVSAGYNVIRSMSSSDGIGWTSSRVVFTERDHGAVGPTISFGDDGRPAVWYVDAGSAGCNASATTVLRRVAVDRDALTPAAPGVGWLAPQPVTIAQPGWVIWHLDVIWIPSKREYWAIYAAYETTKTCGRDELFFARSADGVVWTTYATPFLRSESTSAMSASLYRSTAIYDASSDVLTVWLSGRGRDDVWRAGRVDYRYADFLRALEGGAAASAVVAARD